MPPNCVGSTLEIGPNLLVFMMAAVSAVGGLLSLYFAQLTHTNVTNALKERKNGT